MKYVLLTLITMLLFSCGETDSSTGMTDDGESAPKTVTLSGELTDYDGDIAEVKVYFENEDGDLEETEINEEFIFSIDLPSEENYKCFVEIEGQLSDTLSISEELTASDFSGITFDQKYEEATLTYSSEEGGSYTYGKLKFEFENPYTLTFIDSSRVKVDMKGYSPITYSIENDKDSLGTVFSGDYEYDGVNYIFLNATIHWIMVQQELHIGYEYENCILYSYIKATHEFTDGEVRAYVSQMKYVSIVGAEELE